MRFERRCARLWVLSACLGGSVLGQQAPGISFLNPSSITAGSGAFSMAILGQNFVTGASVYWSGTPLATQFLGATQLLASVPANLVAAPGSALIMVANPGGFQSNTATFTIAAPPLTVTTQTLPTAVAGTPYSFTLSGTGGTPPYNWIASTFPPGLSLNPNGTISGTPTTNGTFNITFRLNDSAQTSVTKALTLTVNPAVISISTTSPLTKGAVGQSYSVTMAVSGGISPHKWTVGTGVPAGLSLNGTTGVLSGTPTVAGTFNFSVQVTDAAQATASRTFALTIAAPALTITTVAPLFTGTAGVAYAQTFSAAGGTPPYRWSISSGDAGGLTLDAASGTLQGTPQRVGTFSFTIQVADNAGESATQGFSVVIAAPQLNITGNASTTAAVGAPYSQRFAATGGTSPYNFSMAGSIPGLAFNATTASLEGTPTSGGSFSFTIQATDSRGFAGSRSFTVTVTAATLRITSSSQLPDAEVGATFTQDMSVIGGVAPYTWSGNGLPDGLNIDAATGRIAGTPAAAGSFAFTVRVIDSARNSSLDLFRINIALPSPPSATISGLPTTLKAADQAKLQVTLDGPYLVPVSGQALISFAPDSGGGDSTIQFSTGGRTADFTIPAGSTEGVFNTGALAIQTGTVAGTVTISVRLQAAGVDITPSPAPAITARVERAAPVISSVRLVRSSGGLSVEVTGYSTAREVIQATFTFGAATGQSLQTSQVTIPVENAFSQWFQDVASARFGSQFTLTQAFAIQGDANAVLLQSVTLTNRVGNTTSNAITQ
jgi:large repetitive protein